MVSTLTWSRLFVVTWNWSRSLASALGNGARSWANETMHALLLASQNVATDLRILEGLDHAFHYDLQLSQSRGANALVVTFFEKDF